jgi:hypothetical protein
LLYSFYLGSFAVFFAWTRLLFLFQLCTFKVLVFKLQLIYCIYLSIYLSSINLLFIYYYLSMYLCMHVYMYLSIIYHLTWWYWYLNSGALYHLSHAPRPFCVSLFFR